MPSHRSLVPFIRGTFLTLMLAIGAVMVASQLGFADPEAWLIRQPPRVEKWISITPEEIEAGAIIPADTNVAFHLPLTFERINREVLLGQKGEDVRYWGYCFPENYESTPSTIKRRIPGKIFLSDLEQDLRKIAAEKVKPVYSPLRIPTKQDLEQAAKDKVGAIRHELEIFQPGLLCYIMSEKELAIGLDPDNDRLNTMLEKEINTKPDTPDTDADGIWDGVEYFVGLQPLIRDSDADGLIDGVEDKDWDGRIDSGETDPKVMDSDRDGLCDGYCRMRIGRRIVYIGEDRNLDGKFTAGGKETDALKPDTDGDGISDFQEFAKCLLNSKKTIRPEEDC